MNRAERRRLDRQQRRELRRRLRERGPDDIVLAVWRHDDPAPMWFNDNVDGHCGGCGAAVYWRPWVPESVEKRCLPCLAQSQAGERQCPS